MMILIVDDEVSNVELLKVRLKKVGCEHLVASTPEKGLELAINASPDLILMDLNMYGDHMRGARLIEEIRMHPAAARIPIVVHSVFVGNSTEAPTNLPPVDGFLAKPFQFKELESIVHRFQADGASRP